MVLRDTYFFASVMFTSQGNIRRKRKAPRLPPKPTSDRMVMKKLRDERIRQAGADEQNFDNHHHANEYYADQEPEDGDNNQNQQDDDEENDNYNQQDSDNGEDSSNLDISDDNEDNDDRDNEVNRQR
jgi:hypothetical protein